MSGQPSHIEIGVPDTARAQKFYGGLDDIDEAARRIVELGGEVDEAGEEGESGRWLYSCRDDQGVTFGLHEPSETDRR